MSKTSKTSKIYYGLIDNNIDITDIALQTCITNGTLNIPSDDYVRAGLFGDPVYGYVKSIFIDSVEYNAETEISIKNFNS